MIRSSNRIILGLLAVLALGLSVTACGDDEETDATSTPAAQTTQPADAGEVTAEEKAANKIAAVDGAPGVSLSVGSKNFTEQYILAEIYVQALSAAGYKVKKELNLGSEVVAYRSLKQGEVDAYPEYTGTALTAFFNVKVKDVPKDPAKAYEDAKAGYAKADITAFAPTPFENSYRLGILKSRAGEFGNPTNISDLKEEAPMMTVNGHDECRQRIDCLLGVEQNYGLKFKKFLPGDAKFQILDNKDADVAFVFTTDGPLSSDKYLVLEDDQNLYPPYNISFTMRNEVAAKLGEGGQKVITDVQKYMTEAVMQELNARVDVDKQEPAAAAQAYLEQFGFVTS